MKVLITTPELQMMGGVANYYKVLRPYLPDNTDYFGACKRDGESWLGTLLRLWRDYRSFKRKLANYDLVHLNPSLGPKALIRDGQFLRIAKKKGKKVVVFFHGWDKGFESILRKRWLWLFRKVYFHADAFVVLAEEFKESLIDMGYKGPIFIETTSVDDSLFQHHIVPQKKDDDQFNILFLTRIERSKGIYEAIEMYAILKKKHNNIKFTIAGDGSELDNIKRYLRNKEYADIELKGFVNETQKLETFLCADCYLLPSYSEGMPSSVLEAMALGLPVITRPVGGLTDFFEDGKMGYITDSRDPQVYADLIEKLIKDPQLRKQMSEYNHKYAKERFMASAVAKRLENIYQKVLRDETAHS